MIKTSFAEEIWNLKYRNGDENEDETYRRVARGLFGDEQDKQIQLYEALKNHKFMTAGRGMYAIGTEKINQTYSNCFVIPIKSDSMIGIMDAAKEAAITMKAGGGVGYSFSVLRPRKSKINSSNQESSGVVSFMKIFNTICDTIMAGGNRRGAQIAVLSINHPEIEDFILAKRDGSLSNFNLSVFIDDNFMSSVRDDGNWTLKFPDTAHPKYNTEWDGNYKKWEQRGYPFVEYKTLRARDLYDKIMKSNYNFAEPGILFEDTINNNNNLKHCEYILASNPCGEIPLQSYGACNLGAINLYNFVVNKFTDDAYFDNEEFKKTVDIAVTSLDTMLNINHVPLKEQDAEMIMKRQVGSGITGLADMLCALKLKYSSNEGRHFVDQIMKTMFNQAYMSSSLLSKEHGCYPIWDFDAFTQTTAWNKLDKDVQESIRENGLRNCKLLTCAPTGTISLFMNNVSSGIEPIFSLQYTRKVKQIDGTTKNETIMDCAWHEYTSICGDPHPPEFFETAQDLDVMSHIMMQETVQKWIDNSISKTTNVPVDYPFEDFKKIYIEAWQRGLKGCTTYRPNSIIGSVLEVKTEDKKTEKDIKKQQKEFYDMWKEHSDKVIIDEVTLPDEYPMRGYKIKSEGKKWYISIAFKDKEMTKPFAIFVHTNNHESDVNTYNIRELLLKLARNENVPEKHIDDQINKAKGQTNVIKITRLISLLLRHNVQINKIVKCLDSVEVPISSFVFRIKKFLMKYIEEVEANGTPCPECGEKMVYRDGCISCESCFYTKCS